MATKLPNVNRLVAEVLTHVDTENAAAHTKTAAPVAYTTSVAQGLQKLAYRLRQAAAAPVSFDDVHSFADKLQEQLR